jgi:hypothetical protein
MLLMDWSSGRDHGHVLGDDEGHPTSVICASGFGSYESGAEYSVEEVVFCPGTRQTVRDGCDHTTFQKLMTLLDKRKVPEGMYYLPEAARRALPDRFTGSLSGWKVIYEEPVDGGRRLLMRYTNGAMAWVNAQSIVEGLVEGLDAQALDMEYSFRFSESEKKRIEAGLARGADGMKAMRELFGSDLAGLSLLGEKTDTYNNWTRRDWHAKDSGIIHLAVTGEGAVEHFYLLERGDAYILLRSYSAV